MTKKVTKNINAVCGMWEDWVIRDNGEIIAEGRGIDKLQAKADELRKTQEKKVVIKYIGGLY